MSFDIGVGIAALMVALTLLFRSMVLKSRYSSIEAAVLFMRRLNIFDFEQIVDPAAEWSLRRISGREFRRLQRQRMRLCAEYLARMAHNAEVTQGWSNRDHSEASSKQRSFADEKTHLLWQLAKTATEVRLFVLIARLEVGVWLLLRLDLLPLSLVPRLDKVRTIGGADLLVAYRNMIDLAKTVSHYYGPDWSEKLNASLG
jgi:hypothetical protein